MNANRGSMVLSDAKKMLDLSGGSRNRDSEYNSGRIKMNS
jgi:hypothetical protein